MSLVKSVALRPGELINVNFSQQKETSFDYQAPDGYNAVVHIIVDVFPKPTGIFMPKNPPAGGKH